MLRSLKVQGATLILCKLGHSFAATVLLAVMMHLGACPEASIAWLKSKSRNPDVHMAEDMMEAQT